MGEFIDRTGWLSRWPDFFPRKKRERTLSLLVGDTLTIKNPEGDPLEFTILNYENLKWYMFRFNLDVYVHKFTGSEGFRYFADAMNDDKASVCMANSNKSVVNISIRGPKNRVCKVVSTRSWGWQKEPTMEFLNALRDLYDLFEYGDHPSPGSLGTNSVRTMLRDAGQKRYVRPGNILRNKLFEYGCGGRADEFDEPRMYDDAYAFDFDNFYAKEALLGVPAGRPVVTGLAAFSSEESYVWRTPEFLDDYATAFCEVRVLVPHGITIAPFYIRNKDGSLHWVTEPGIYYWWLWKEMIYSCIESGCKVEIGLAYCWEELDTFLEPFIIKALNLRTELQKIRLQLERLSDKTDEIKRRIKQLKLEEVMCKKMIVSTFGSFGMRPFVLSWFRWKGGQKGIYLSLIQTQALERA